MTTFSYTTGNPGHLTGGAAASMTDIGGSFTDIQTFLNGGNIDATNLATSAKPVTLKGDYRTVSEGTGIFTSTTASGINLLTGSGLYQNGSADTNQAYPVPILAADFTVSGLTAKLRVRAAMLTNTTSSTRIFTAGLYPISNAQGNANQLTVVAGTVVTGSTVAITPGASASIATPTVGTDFSLPADGLYVLGVSLNGAPAANSKGLLWMRLEVHYV